MRAQLLAMRYSGKGRMIHRFCAFLGVMMLLGGVLNFHRHAASLAEWVVPFALGVFFFSIPLFTRRAIHKFYAQKLDRDMEVTWEISDDGIRAKTELMASENKWAVFQKAVKAKEGFLLYPSSSMYHWIPMHAFRDGDAERFAELVKEKIKDYQQAV